MFGIGGGAGGVEITGKEYLGWEREQHRGNRHTLWGLAQGAWHGMGLGHL